MENLRDAQGQAKQLERAGRYDDAADLYHRILERTGNEAPPVVWVGLAGVQLAMGRGAEAADSFVAAAERFGDTGLRNLALAHWQRAIRADEARLELLLRFAHAAAAAGYRRDARRGFALFADRAAAEGDRGKAVNALHEYLEHFPDDAAARARIAELSGDLEGHSAAPSGSAHPADRGERAHNTGQEEVPGDVQIAAPGSDGEPAGEIGPDDGGAVAPLPGLIPTSAEPPDPGAGLDLERSENVRGGEGEPTSGGGAPPIAPLEGLQPTHLGDRLPEGGSDSPAPRQESALSPLGSGEMQELVDTEHGGGSGPSPQDDVSGEEQDPLPLLGFEGTDEEGPRSEALRPQDPVEAGSPESTGEAQHGQELPSLAERSGPVTRRPEAEPAATAARAGSDDRARIVESYIALATALEGEMKIDEARDALRRALELEPSNEQARTALEGMSAVRLPADDYIDLGALILADVPEEETRFQVDAAEPSGDEDEDFAEILDLFRQKVSRHLDPRDAASHYDLGLAFKEMGLIDDAIIHLQAAFRGGAHPLASLEELGDCFVRKGQPGLAARIYDRATRLPGVAESDLVGVLYGLARSQEALGRADEARDSYERLVAVDLSFRDAAERLRRLQAR